jgi:hypothetical protein
MNLKSRSQEAGNRKQEGQKSVILSEAKNLVWNLNQNQILRHFIPQNDMQKRGDWRQDTRRQENLKRPTQILRYAQDDKAHALGLSRLMSPDASLLAFLRFFPLSATPLKLHAVTDHKNVGIHVACPRIYNT